MSPPDSSGSFLPVMVKIALVESVQMTDQVGRKQLAGLSNFHSAPEPVAR